MLVADHPPEILWRARLVRAGMAISIENQIWLVVDAWAYAVKGLKLRPVTVQVGENEVELLRTVAPLYIVICTRNSKPSTRKPSNPQP